jgi:hypothetical protein
MRTLNIPLGLIIIFIILAWLGVLYIYWIKPTIIPKVDNYFAIRRRRRRLRNRTAPSAMIDKILANSGQDPYLKKTKSAKLYDINTTQVGGIPYHAPARHRR